VDALGLQTLQMGERGSGQTLGHESLQKLDVRRHGLCAAYYTRRSEIGPMAFLLPAKAIFCVLVTLMSRAHHPDRARGAAGSG
jgi:hypothetical protein